jgi:hypothetical protein
VVFEEDEQVPTAGRDRQLSLAPAARVEPGVEAAGVGAQLGVVEVGAQPGDAASALDQLAQGGREGLSRRPRRRRSRN